MALWSAIPVLGSLLDKLGKLIPDRGKVADNQAWINEQEVEGAPASRLRLWRSFLGWCLSLCFVWEVMVRPIIAVRAGAQGRGGRKPRLGGPAVPGR